MRLAAGRLAARAAAGAASAAARTRRYGLAVRAWSGAAAPTPPPAGLHPADTPLPPARARAAQRAATPPATFRIAGVTFEGRQDAVASLRPGQALRLVREPDNPVDPGAVRVETLGGARLGYVPRDRTAEVLPVDAVPGGVAFARVLSVGQATAGDGGDDGGGGGGDPGGPQPAPHDDHHRHHPWGAAVTVHPGLRPLAVDALPASLAAAADLAAWLPPAVWDGLRAATARRAGFRCEVTGGRGPGCAVAVRADWALHAPTRTAVLTGLVALHPDAHAASAALALSTPDAIGAAVGVLRSVNEWTTEEAAEHVAAAAAVAAAAEAEDGWRLDLGWLARAVPGLELPPDIAALCVPLS